MSAEWDCQKHGTTYIGACSLCDMEHAQHVDCIAERDHLKAVLEAMKRAAACYREAAKKGLEAFNQSSEENTLLRARVERLEKVLGDIQYCFQNVWALDRKAFQDGFMPKIKEALRDGEGKA